MTSIATPLVWRHNDKFNTHEAQGYDIQQNTNGSCTVKPLGANRIFMDRFEVDLPNLDAAKEACQQHADECAVSRLSDEARAWLAEGIRAKLDKGDADFGRITKTVNS